MSKVHHYMVDFEGKDGKVHFANDRELFDLKDAKALARRQSKLQPCSAAVVAFVVSRRSLDNPTVAVTYEAVGHVAYFDGRVSDTAGVFAA